jgi:predicted nucleic acid-binding protein
MLVRRLYQRPTVTVHPHSRGSFLTGLALYEARPDKGYSLSDCISMETMRQEGITEILTHDAHFTQEGFIILR